MFVEFAKGVAFLLALCTIQGFIGIKLRDRELPRVVLSGLAYGFVCIVGMMTPIVIAPGVIFDARSVVLAICGLMGGPVPSAIAGAIAGGYRIWLGGPGAPVGVAVVVSCVVLGLAYREAVKRGWLRIRVGELLAFGFIVHAVELGLFTFLPEPYATTVMNTLAVPMLVTFTPATAMLGGLLKLLEDRIVTRQLVEEANLRFRQIAENIREVFFMTDPERQQTIYVSPAYETVWRRKADGLFENSTSFFDAVHPDDRERVRTELGSVRNEYFETTYRIVRPDGTVRSIRHRCFPVRNEAGEVYRIASVADDITEHEERLEQLQQAQKMEALGQLTGGVAHDFNNLLQIIHGNAEILSDRSETEDSSLQAIQRATRRGSDLTQRLLAFARRQPLRPGTVDVAELVERVSGLIRRTLGSGITYTIHTEPGLWPARVDPAQLENALVNLSINARDAMSEKGTLAFDCRSVSVAQAPAGKDDAPPAGDFVCVSVTDDGAGMSEEVRAHAFEPFFTTKEVGDGSGLGLSMVYGFIKQSGGHVAIRSRLGAGTTIAMYLPRATGPAEAEIEAAPAAEPVAAAGTRRRLLVIEDDPDIRTLAAAFLEALGYDTLEAADSGEAATQLERASAIAPVDGLLCDIVLPGGLNGPEFAKEALARHPGLKVVFMSGYPEGLNRDINDRIGDSVLLRKPFRKSDLGDALRRAFERDAAPEAGN
jgi:two-component system cell cycle sensor histidine kinase/response regulator CckA